MSKTHIPVLVTRAEPGASETVSRLENEGFTAIKTPVMHVVPDAAVTLPDLSDVSGLVFTSANGVRAFVDRSEERVKTAWCVGPATATAARYAGFSNVEESAGDARDLAAFIAERIAPSDQPLLHIANAAAKGDLRAALEQAGYNVVFCPLYRMQGAESLDHDVIDILNATAPAIVLVHSEKGAEAFVDLAKNYPTDNLKGVAISDRAAVPLRKAGLDTPHVADVPNEDGLFIALNRAVATLSA
ncbi:MAG: uroporphyrinogen-III synthase [Pseudomonadota bacterium]